MEYAFEAAGQVVADSGADAEGVVLGFDVADEALRFVVGFGWVDGAEGAQCGEDG